MPSAFIIYDTFVADTNFQCKYTWFLTVFDAYCAFHNKLLFQFLALTKQIMHKMSKQIIFCPTTTMSFS